jgi:hypothetical protein
MHAPGPACKNEMSKHAYALHKSRYRLVFPLSAVSPLACTLVRQLGELYSGPKVYFGACAENMTSDKMILLVQVRTTVMSKHPIEAGRWAFGVDTE